jgi:tRNA pseudouridine32 synthase / 23S rRNA pseudouridine746 synthase
MLVIAIANEKRMAKRWRPNAYIRLFFFSIVVVVDWIAILKFSVVHALSLSLGASVSSSSSISASTLEPTCEIEVSSAAARNSTTLSEVGHQQTRHQSPSISTFSSFQFRAEGLRSSFVQNENTVSPSTSGCILPLQKYHMNHIRRDGEMSSRLVNSAGGIEIPNLDFVIQNLHQFNLSVSSMTLLQQFQEEQTSKSTEASPSIPPKPVNPSFLLSKIRNEHWASRPLSTEILQILYCDEHICVVNKPSGVLSVPGHRRNPSMANLVHDTLKPPIDVDQTVVHRLDMATSGILVFALSLEALSQLHEDFKERRVYKIYQCLVHGHLPAICSLEGEIDVALERDPNNPPFMRVAQEREENHNGDDVSEIDGESAMKMQHKFWREAPKPSLTEYRILGHETRNGQPVTRLEMKPLTGRTHQLRVHTAQALGTPIVGDDIYGLGDLEENIIDGPLCLHAQKLCIYHPISGAPMIFEADAPF